MVGILHLQGKEPYIQLKTKQIDEHMTVETFSAQLFLKMDQIITDNLNVNLQTNQLEMLGFTLYISSVIPFHNVVFNVIANLLRRDNNILNK